MSRRNHAALVAVALAAAGCGDNAADAGLTLRVIAMPDRQWYQTDQPVMLVGFPTDADGQLHADLPLVWSVDPPAAAADGDAANDPLARNYLLREIGTVTFTACRAKKDGTPHPSGPCGSLALRVDDGSPALELTDPVPGAELDDPAGIVVRGSVADAGRLRVFVGGNLVELDELGQFETVLPGEFGVNRVLAVASDGLTDESAVEMDVMWAAGYAPAISAGGLPEVAVGSAIALSVGQRVFDDGQPVDMTADPIVVRDLADVVELVVNRLPILDQLPDPVIDQASIRLRIPAADVGAVNASIDVTDDGLDLFLRVPALALTTEGFLSVDSETLDLAGTVTAQVAISADVTLGKAGPAAPIVVAVDDLWVALESMTGDFDDAETAAIFQIAGSLLRSTIEDQLQEVVQDTIATSLPGLLLRVLEGLDTGLSGIELTFDNDLLSAPITLTLDGSLGSAIPRTGQDLLAGLQMRVGTTTAARFPGTRGVPLFEPTDAMDPGLYRDRQIQLGVRLTMLNAALHALWSSGLLEIDLSGLAPGVVDTGTLSGKLAPVVRPPRGGNLAEPADGLILSLGQLELELGAEGEATARFGVSIDAPLAIDLASDAIAIDASVEPRIDVWSIDGEMSTVFTEELIHALLLEQWPKLRDPLLGSLSFDLPVVTLSDLGDIAPDLADLTLSLEPSAAVTFRRAHLLLEAGVRGALSR